MVVIHPVPVTGGPVAPLSDGHYAAEWLGKSCYFAGLCCFINCVLTFTFCVGLADKLSPLAGFPTERSDQFSVQFFLFFLAVAEQLQEVKHVYYEVLNRRGFEAGDIPYGIRVHFFHSNAKKAELCAALNGVLREGKRQVTLCAAKPTHSAKRAKLNCTPSPMDDAEQQFSGRASPYAIHSVKSLIERHRTRGTHSDYSQPQVEIPAGDLMDQMMDAPQDSDSMERVLDTNDPLYAPGLLSADSIIDRKRPDSIHFVGADGQTYHWKSLHMINAQIALGGYKSEDGYQFPENVLVYKIPVHGSSKSLPERILHSQWLWLSTSVHSVSIHKQSSSLDIAAQTSGTTQFRDVHTSDVAKSVVPDHIFRANEALVNLATATGSEECIDHVLRCISSATIASAICGSVRETCIPAVTSRGMKHLVDCTRVKNNKSQPGMTSTVSFYNTFAKQVEFTGGITEALYVNALWLVSMHAGVLSLEDRMIVILHGPPGTGKSMILRFVTNMLIFDFCVSVVTGMSPCANTGENGDPTDCTVAAVDEGYNVGIMGADSEGNCTAQTARTQALFSHGLVSHVYLELDPTTGQRKAKKVVNFARYNYLVTVNALYRQLSSAMLDRAITIYIPHACNLTGASLRAKAIAGKPITQNNKLLFVDLLKPYKEIHFISGYFFSLLTTYGVLPAGINTDLLQVMTALAANTPCAQLLGLSHKEGSPRSTIQIIQLLISATRTRIANQLFNCGLLGPDIMSKDLPKMIRFIAAHNFIHTEDLAMWYITGILNDDAFMPVRFVLNALKTSHVELNNRGIPVVTRIAGADYYTIDVSTNSVAVDDAMFPDQLLGPTIDHAEQLKRGGRRLLRMCDKNDAYAKYDPITKKLHVLATIMDMILTQQEHLVLRVWRTNIVSMVKDDRAVLNGDNKYVVPLPDDIVKLGVNGPNIYSTIDNLGMRTKADNTFVQYPSLTASRGAMPGYVTVIAFLKNSNVIAGADLFQIRQQPEGPDCLVVPKQTLDMVDVDPDIQVARPLVNLLRSFGNGKMTIMTGTKPLVVDSYRPSYPYPITITNPRAFASATKADPNAVLFDWKTDKIKWTGIPATGNLDDLFASKLHAQRYGFPLPPSWKTSAIEETLVSHDLVAPQVQPGEELCSMDIFDM